MCSSKLMWPSLSKFPIIDLKLALLLKEALLATVIITSDKKVALMIT